MEQPFACVDAEPLQEAIVISDIRSRPFNNNCRNRMLRSEFVSMTLHASNASSNVLYHWYRSQYMGASQNALHSVRNSFNSVLTWSLFAIITMSILHTASMLCFNFCV